MTQWRTGQKLGRTLYLQEGPEPSEADRFLGMMETVRRFHEDFKAPAVGEVWRPRRRDDPKREDPLKVEEAQMGNYLCKVLDGGSSTVRRSGLELNLYYEREET
jgi:hypothetical protein